MDINYKLLVDHMENKIKKQLLCHVMNWMIIILLTTKVKTINGLILKKGI